MMFLDGYIEAPPTITVFSCPMAANAAGAAPVAASASASPITSARAECFDFIAHLLWSASRNGSNDQYGQTRHMDAVARRARNRVDTPVQFAFNEKVRVSSGSQRIGRVRLSRSV